MQFNQPKARICFKLDSNWLLIKFFYPISGVCRDDSIQIQTQISNLNLIYIKNWSNTIENGRKQTDFVVFIVVFNKNWLFQSFNQLFRLFNRLFLYLYRSFNQNRSNLDRKWSRLDRICNSQLKFIVRFWIGPKSMIEIDPLGIRIVVDLICKP